jgi:uncharacterized membrane protein
MDKPMHAIHQFAPLPRVAHVAPLRPLLWLRLGWDDLRHKPGPSIAHGLLLVMIGWLIVLFFSAQIDLLAAAVCAYALVGPVFAAGFYELSRLRAAGLPASFDASLDGALRNGRRLATLGLVLAALVVAWVWLSGLLFSRAFGGVPPSIGDNLYRTVLDWNYTGFFVSYLSMGAILALLAFIVSAISAPMIFDRAAGTSTAILTSLKAVAINPAAMAVWAALIALLTAIGFATFLLGLAIILPWLGHATWHAYRDLIA